MYQNNESANYLFGGKYNEKSFAKDLIGRDSNVILLDEFDKAYSVFHSAFYQLFDEGIYEDQNYKVDVRHALIICTSNYKSKDEVREKLGNPIFNRFDGVIRFTDLDSEAKIEIARKELDELDEEGKCYKIGEKDLVTRDNDFEMATGNSTGVIGYDSRIKKKGTNQVDRTKAPVPTTLLNSAITNYCSDPQKIMFILQKTDADDTYNKLFYEIKKDLFQIEKEGFTDALKSLISL